MAKPSGYDAQGLINKALSRPDLFPEQFLSWLRRFITDNSLIHVSPAQGAGSGGGTTKRHIVIQWQFQTPPSASGPGGAWIIPEVDGASITFTLNKQTLFFPTLLTNQVQAKTQHSVDNGATYSDIQLSTVPAGSRENVTTPSGTVTSGDIVQINWVQVGSGSGLCTLELEGDEA